MRDRSWKGAIRPIFMMSSLLVVVLPAFGARWVLSTADPGLEARTECIPTTEICDGIDNDCDDLVDEDLTFDVDGDGHTRPDSCEGTKDDCNDSVPTAYPGAPEICDSADNDCDGDIDEDLTFDDDNDGHTTPSSCDGNRDDCDDNDPTVHPAADEVCDGVDNDCDLFVDEGLTFDQDADGHTTPGSCAGTRDDCNDANPAIPTTAELCDGVDSDCDGSLLPGGEVDDDGDGFLSCNDCDDGDPNAHPGAAEVCDAVDNDCNTLVDEGLTFDADGDGHSHPLSCAGTRDDCNDTDPASYPGAIEVCDGADNDCDMLIDDGLTFDLDSDGHTTPGSCAGTRDDCDDNSAAAYPGAVEVCDGVDNDCDGSFLPGGEVDGDADGSRACDDCDDADPTVYPGGPEICDGIDNDCDSAVDEGLTFDQDGDGYTDPLSCFGTRDDCDDTDPNAHPSATEICDGTDNDCDGFVDGYLSFDADSDGHTTPDSCEGTRDDCDDTDASIHPGAVEICDGADTDCDGIMLPGGEADGDGDSFFACEDCDDTRAWTFPGAPEYCDGIDNDCNGLADDGLTFDDDGDGHTDPISCWGTRDDCDDGDPLTHPGAEELCLGADNNCDSLVNWSPEICDGLDNDCDGLVLAGETVDRDGDKSFACIDCNEHDPDVYSGAPELNDGKDNNCPGDVGYGQIDETSGVCGFQTVDSYAYSWAPQEGAGSYEVVRSSAPDFSVDCTRFTTTDSYILDSDEPAVGEVLYYLTRPTTPHAGSWGARSGRVERAVLCP